MVSKKTIVITGSSGIIGASLSRALRKSFTVFGIDTIPDKLHTQFTLDITNDKSFKRVLVAINPDIIIHTAAMKDMKLCQENETQAYNNNVKPAKTIFSYLQQESGKKLIYISSDIVFDGIKGDYDEKDTTNPINVYGKTKLECEKIFIAHENVAICRTAMVLKSEGDLKTPTKQVLNELKKDTLYNQSLFIEYVYHALKKGVNIYLSKVHLSNPTPNKLLTQIIQEVISKDARGVLHTAGPVQISRYDFALEVARHFNLNREFLHASSTVGTLPYRPKNVTLNVKRTYEVLSIDDKNWSISDIINSSIR
jgi:dTDP-4-dehydrorhamnose reductase